MPLLPPLKTFRKLQSRFKIWPPSSLSGWRTWYLHWFGSETLPCWLWTLHWLATSGTSESGWTCLRSLVPSRNDYVTLTCFFVFFFSVWFWQCFANMSDVLQCSTPLWLRPFSRNSERSCLGWEQDAIKASKIWQAPLDDPFRFEWCLRVHSNFNCSRRFKEVLLLRCCKISAIQHSTIS